MEISKFVTSSHFPFFFLSISSLLTLQFNHNKYPKSLVLINQRTMFVRKETYINTLIKLAIARIYAGLYV